MKHAIHNFMESKICSSRKIYGGWTTTTLDGVVGGDEVSDDGQHFRDYNAGQDGVPIVYCWNGSGYSEC